MRLCVFNRTPGLDRSGRAAVGSEERCRYDVWGWTEEGAGAAVVERREIVEEKVALEMIFGVIAELSSKVAVD